MLNMLAYADLDRVFNEKCVNLLASDFVYNAIPCHAMHACVIIVLRSS